MNRGGHLKNNELAAGFWSKFSKRVVFLDFETTGINFDTDRIIEIGALALEGDSIGREYQTFINPQTQLPPIITTLTGITGEMLASAPLVESQREAFEEFVRDAIVIAHNANFEKNFISRFFPGASCAGFIDSCEIAMLLVPTLKYYNLEKILNLYEIKDNEDHRALLDAKDTYYAINNMVAEALSTPDRDFLSNISSGGRRAFEAPTAEFFDNLLTLWDEVNGKPAKKTAGRKKSARVPAAGKPAATPGDGQSSFGFLPEPTLEDALKNLSNSAFESEYQLQSAFVGSIMAAFAEEKYLLAEIPHKTNRIDCVLHTAGLHSKRTREAVLIIESQTAAIDEIARYHLPNAEAAFGGEISFSILKDPDNYACTKNLAMLGETAATPEEAFLVLYLECYLRRTPDGCLDSLAPFMTNKYPQLREKIEFVKASEFCCRSGECEMKKNCCFRSAVYRYMNSDVMIAPLSHYFKWRETVKRPGPGPTKVIFDQAHKLEDSFAESYAARFSRSEIMGSFDECAKGLAATCSAHAGLEAADHCRRSFESCVSNTAEFFDYAASLIAGATGGQGAPQTITMGRLFEDTNLQEVFLEKIINLSIYYKHSEKHFERLKSAVIPRIADVRERSQAVYTINRLIRTLRRYCDNYLALLQFVDSTYTAYLKYDQNRGEWIFCTEPVDVGKILSKQLFPFTKSVVFVSAALSVYSSFDFLKWVLGLQKFKNLETRTFVRANRPEQYGFVIPKEMPVFDSKNTGPFVAKLGELVIKIASKKGGRTMVLFNSIERMGQVHKAVLEEFSKRGIPCLCQRSETLKYRMLETLKKHPTCVIFGSQSMMDFPDMQDESIDTLIIEKIPFPFLEDPRILARKKLAQTRGLQEFEDYVLPKTILRIKQAIGRLAGRGLLVIADSKLITARYLRDITYSIHSGSVHYTFEEYWRDNN